MGTQIAWSDIPAGLQIGLIALAVVQIGVEVYALVKLFKTPDEQLVVRQEVAVGAHHPVREPRRCDRLPGGRPQARSGSGPARRGAAEGAPAAGDRAARAADVLYGERG